MRSTSIDKLKKTNNAFLKQNLSEILIVGLGFILLVSFVIFVFISGLNRSTWLIEILYFLPFSIYIAILVILKKTENYNTSNFFPVIIVFATFFQILILITEVSLSNDIYRFFIEGKAIINGINPYIIPIEQFPTSLRDNFYDLVNNSHVSSPYPPLALLLFVFLYILGNNPATFRFVFSLSFLVSILILNQLIPDTERWKLIVYAWNPLLHIETANGAHFEPLVVLAVMLALLALNSKHPVIASVLFLSAFLLKYYPIFLLSVYWKQLGKKGGGVFISGLFLYFMFIFLMPQSIYGVLTYTMDFYFNASVLWFLISLTGNFDFSKIVVGVVFIGILIFVSIKANTDVENTSKSAVLVLGMFLLLQPSFHPWYIFWLFPFVLLTNKTWYSWILLSGTLILSYHVYITYDTIQIWKELDLFRLAEYLPFFSLLIFESREFLKVKIRQIRKIVSRGRSSNSKVLSNQKSL